VPSIGFCQPLKEGHSMKSKSFFPILVAILFLALVSQFLYAEDAAQNKQAKKFTGAWFEIQYPPDFSAEPSLKSTTNATGPDSVFFVAPSKEVSFYVYSPQWNGTATDILLKDDKETQVSLKKTEKNGVITLDYTIAAKDGSYTRSYVDVEDTNSNTRQVFGITYRDQKILDQYKDLYTQFKSSLVQFAD
jgi:hypothetical protein